LLLFAITWQLKRKTKKLNRVKWKKKLSERKR
jgi:hypothetical protein